MYPVNRSVRIWALASLLVLTASGFADAACYNSQQALFGEDHRSVHIRPRAAIIRAPAWRRADDIHGTGFGRFRSDRAATGARPKRERQSRSDQCDWNRARPGGLSLLAD